MPPLTPSQLAARAGGVLVNVPSSAMDGLKPYMSTWLERARKIFPRYRNVHFRERGDALPSGFSGVQTPTSGDVAPGVRVVGLPTAGALFKDKAEEARAIRAIPKTVLLSDIHDKILARLGTQAPEVSDYVAEMQRAVGPQFIMKPKGGLGSGGVGFVTEKDNILKIPKSWLKSYVVQQRHDLRDEPRIVKWLQNKLMPGDSFGTGKQEWRVHTMDGRVVPGATVRRGSTLSAMNPFTGINGRRAERAAQAALDGITDPDIRRRAFGFDIAKTRDGRFIPIESNPADATGASGLMTSNPLVVDAHVAAAQGRTPLATIAKRIGAGGAALGGAGLALPEREPTLLERLGLKRASAQPIYDWDGTLIPRIPGAAGEYLKRLQQLSRAELPELSRHLSATPVDIATARPPMFHPAIIETAKRLGLNVRSIEHADGDKVEHVRQKNRPIVDDSARVVEAVRAALGPHMATKAAALMVRKKKRMIEEEYQECPGCGVEWHEKGGPRPKDEHMDLWECPACKAELEYPEETDEAIAKLRPEWQAISRKIRDARRARRAKKTDKSAQVANDVCKSDACAGMSWRPCAECGGVMHGHLKDSPAGHRLRGSIVCHGCGWSTPGMKWHAEEKTAALRLGRLQCLRARRGECEECGTPLTDGCAHRAKMTVDEVFKYAQAADHPAMRLLPASAMQYTVPQRQWPHTATAPEIMRAGVADWGADKPVVRRLAGGTINRSLGDMEAYYRQMAPADQYRMSAVLRQRAAVTAGRTVNLPQQMDKVTDQLERGGLMPREAYNHLLDRNVQGAVGAYRKAQTPAAPARPPTAAAPAQRPPLAPAAGTRPMGSPSAAPRPQPAPRPAMASKSAATIPADALSDHAAVRGAANTAPSQAQRDAGNYEKARVRLHGLDIAIENPAGSTRSGKAKDGTEWSVKMRNHYGYIRGTEGADGDAVDVFIGPNPESEIVFIVEQNRPGTDTFDEVKCVIGCTTEDAAKQLYLDNYSKGWSGFRAIHACTVDQFKWWLDNADHKKPMPRKGMFAALRKKASMQKLIPMKIVRGERSVASFIGDVAKELPEQKMGMMKYPEPVPGLGMFFYTPGPFWMAKVGYDLDILFADAGGRVLDVQTMKAASVDDPGSEWRVYASRVPGAACALEVPAGWAAQHGVVAGDVIRPDVTR